MSDGLAEVIAAQTVLSHADGEKGKIWVRGHRIGELVARYGCEGTIALLWESFAGDDLTRAGVLAQLGLARKLAFSRLDDWLPAAKRRPLIEGVRMALAALPRTATLRPLPQPCRSPWLPFCACGKALHRLRRTTRSQPPPIFCTCCTARRPTKNLFKRSMPISRPSLTTVSAHRPSRPGSSSRPAPPSSPRSSAPTARLPEACTAGRLRSRSTCSTRFRKPATSCLARAYLDKRGTAHGFRASRVSNSRSARGHLARGLAATRSAIGAAFLCA